MIMIFKAIFLPLLKIVNATEKFDFVLDFSAYEAKWVHDAVGILQGKLDKDTGVYLYISSDSVKQKNPENYESFQDVR